MSLSPRLLNFISEITAEQQIIQNHLLHLKSDGILDIPLETFLHKSIQGLQLRKENLIKDFSQPHPPTNQFNLHSILIKKKPIESIFHSEKPKIFTKNVSPERGSSPSATRYSSKAETLFEKYEKKTGPEINARESPVGSTRSSRSSEDKLVNEASNRKEEEEMKVKYQELREVRNKAHEEMLLLKEQMLKNKETKLNELIKQASYDNLKEKRKSIPRFSEKPKKCSETQNSRPGLNNVNLIQPKDLNSKPLKFDLKPNRPHANLFH